MHHIVEDEAEHCAAHNCLTVAIGEEKGYAGPYWVCESETEDWRHDESHSVHWEVVMHAME